jgi:hypothetical protein
VLQRAGWALARLFLYRHVIFQKKKKASTRSEGIEKLAVAHLIKELPAYYGIQNFLSFFTRAYYYWSVPEPDESRPRVHISAKYLFIILGSEVLTAVVMKTSVFLDLTLLWSVESQQTFRSDMAPPSSYSKNKSSKKLSRSK